MKINERTLRKLQNIFWRLEPDCPIEPDPNAPSEYAQGIRDLLELLVDEENK